jgi:nucleotide-binding universal stress UspA family protein
MSLKNLLVHLDRSAASALRVEVAAALARQFSATLTGFFAAADPHVQSLSSYDRLQLHIPFQVRAENMFRNLTEGAVAATEWRSLIAVDDIQVAQQLIFAARYSDLAILSQFDQEKADGSIPPDLVEQVVMRSGRPVLVVPFAGRFPSVGQRVVVAWNGSREAARAINDALPFLEQARKVTVLSLTAKDEPLVATGTAKFDISLHLDRHGVANKADRLVFDAKQMDPGERLLSYLADEAADLLVMGAWGRLAIRRSVRKSLTSSVLSRMTVPVLLSC